MDRLEITMDSDSPDCQSAFVNVLRHHNNGGLASRVFYKEHVLDIEAEALKRRGVKLFVGGGWCINDSVFQSMLIGNLRSLVIK